MYKNKILPIISLTLLLLLSGCKTTPGYQANVLNINVASDLSNQQTISPLRFDAFVVQALQGKSNYAGAFGILGVLASYSADESPEAFSLGLQSHTMKTLSERFGRTVINYKDVDLLQKYGLEETEKRFKSNVMWGFSSLKSKELQSYFKENPEVKYALYPRTKAYLPGKRLIVQTEWFIYDSAGVIVAEIETRTVEQLGKDVKEEDYYDIVIRLQNQNIDEFFKILDLPQKS